MQTLRPASNRSSGPSTVRDLPAIVSAAGQCRTIQQALADPHTLRSVEAIHGRAAVVVETSAAITAAMGYFAVGRALNPIQITLLAETLLEQYPHETMSDVALFLRRAALGEFDEGKTYGALDVPTALRWWRQYLSDKAEAMEREAKCADAASEEAGKAILGLPDVREAVAAIAANAREEQRESDAVARIERLRAALPAMSREELRMAWKLYDRPMERALIHAQAARSGYFNEEIRAAQEAIDKEQHL